MAIEYRTYLFPNNEQQIYEDIIIEEIINSPK